MDLSTGVVHGEDREALQENARLAGQPFDPQRPIIQFRDLTKASGASGGYLVGTEVQETTDILRPWSTTTRAGVQVESGLVGDQAIPKVTAKSTPAWLPTEGTQISPSTPSLVQISLSPKQVGCVVNFSRQLAKQSNASKFVANELLKTIGTAIDQAVISGSGVSGTPLGLLNSAGLQSQSGTTLNSGVLTMLQKCSEANCNDSQISFLSTPAVRQLLQTRERATGGGRFVWDKDQVADRPAFVSTDIPTATMISGDWSLIYVGIWGAGFVLEVNPFANFQAGIISARMIVACDIAVRHPSAFIAATSIT